MVNWQSPIVLLQCARAFQLIVHALFGIYFWEFLSSFKFDWEHFTGKRKWRWTFVLYLLARYCMLLGLIAGVRISNAMEAIDCLAWNRVVYAFAHLTFVFSSLLLLLRVLAVADRQWKLAVPLWLFWLANVGCLFYGIIKAEAFYIPQLFLCGATNTVHSRLNVAMSFAFDVCCLVIMLVLLMKSRGGNLWKFLVSQGIGFFILSVCAYAPSLIFLILNLNDAMNEIPQVFAVTAMAICATRMHRHLTLFAAPPQLAPLGMMPTPPKMSASMNGLTSTTRAAHLKSKGAEINVDVQVERHGRTDDDKDSDEFAMQKMDVGRLHDMHKRYDYDVV